MTLATVFCTLAAIGLVAVGVLALLSPQRLARSYGVEVEESSSYVYVRAAGVRDLILGAILGAASYTGDSIALLFLCALGVILSLADFTLAFTFTRRMRSELVSHLGGAVGFIVIIILLLQTLRR